MDVKIAAAVFVVLLLGAAVFVSAGDGGDAEQEARIASLEARIEILQDRVETLEKRRGRRGPRGPEARRDRRERGDEGGWSEGRERRRGDGRRGGAPDLAAALDTADPEVREKVSNLVREEMEAASEQRWEERRRRRAERIERALADFAAAQSLSAADQEGLTDLWADERETITDLFRKAREDMSWGKAREEAEAIRERTDAAAREMLSEENYAAWVVLREEENPRHR